MSVPLNAWCFHYQWFPTLVSYQLVCFSEILTHKFHDSTLMVESEQELRSRLMKVKEDGEKAGLKLNIQKKLGSWHPVPSVQFSSVQSLSNVQLFATPWIAACQASLSITNSQSSLRLTSIESVMPSSHLILCRPLFLLPPIPPQHQSLFQWVNSSHEVVKVLEFGKLCPT